MLTRIAVIAVLVILFGYGVVKAWPLLSGPSLSIDFPTPYTTSGEDGFTQITGTAYNTESLALNGGPILIDQNGHFEETLVLPKGGGILTLTAKDRFGRSTSLQRTVFVP